MPKKSQRTAARRRAGGPSKGRRRTRRLLRIAPLVLAGAVGLYVVDYLGPLERVRGTVASTRTYPHGGTHMHTEAVIEYEGGRHRLAQADGLTRGQTLWVDVRRGRLSGRLRFVAHGGTAPDTAAQPGSTEPVPWAYDPIEDRHWNPIHGHWHDGPPPARERQ